MPVPFYLDRARSEENTSANFLRQNRIIDNDIVRRNNAQAVASSINNFLVQNIEAIRNARRASQRLPSDWTETIDYNNGYQHEVEDRFRKEHRYLELADYLSHFRMDTPMQQREYDNEITQLRRYGRQYDALHSKATDEQEHSISFLEAYNNGSIDDLDNKNPLKEQYLNAVDFLGRDVKTTDFLGAQLETPEIGENDASTISVTFNNKHVSYGLWGLPIIGADFLSKDVDENQFSKFAKDTGYDIADIRSLVGDNSVSRKDGRLTINIPKTNLKGIKLLTEIRKWCNETGRSSDDVSYASYDTKNDLISDNTVSIGSQIQGIADFLDRRNQDENDVMGSINSGEQIMSTTFLPYMNERQMRLKQLVGSGALDDSKLKAAIDADNELYYNALANTAFSQYEVYATKNDEEANEDFYPLDNVERGKLSSYINNAIREKRITMGVGISGGRYGTIITVLNEDDKGNLINDADDARSGSSFFIPDLFTESAQNAFNASTQGKTVAEINSMQQYDYQYTFQNGDILSNVGNNGARLYNKKTDSYEYKTREEAHNLLHQDIIVQDASNSIKNRMFNLDGSLRQGYDYKAAAQAIAVAGANEVYPNNPIDLADVWPVSSSDMAARNAVGNLDKDYKVEQAANIYNEIMNNIYKLINVK